MAGVKARGMLREKRSAMPLSAGQSFALLLGGPWLYCWQIEARLVIS